MNEAQARKLETETKWNGKANVCIHCGRVPETFYIVTGHDHTDDSIRWCICRERYSQSEKHALLKENAALRAEIEFVTKVELVTNARIQDAKDAAANCKQFNDSLHQQLAISQLEAKRLRGALDETTIALEHRWEVIANRAAPVMESVIDAAHTKGIQALSSPTSTEALDAYVAEKVKEKVEEHRRATVLRYEQTVEIIRQRDLAVSAIENLVKQKGRHNTEIAYKKLVESLAAIKENEDN